MGYINIDMTQNIQQINAVDQLVTAWDGHKAFAMWLVQEMQPKVTVELGVDYGFSMFTLGIHNPGTVYGVDLFQGDEHAGTRDANEQYASVLKFKEDYGFSNVEVIKGDFNDVAKDWNEKIDILHIDGLHTYEAVKNDFLTWAPKLADNGIILMHDVTAWPGVTKFFFNDIAVPRLFFEHSAGLGIVSHNAELLKTISAMWPMANKVTDLTPGSGS